MARGIIKGLPDSLRETAEELPDSRESGNALKYRISDAIMSAFAVFYFQHPSLLNFQQDAEETQTEQPGNAVWSTCHTLFRSDDEQI